VTEFGAGLSDAGLAAGCWAERAPAVDERAITAAAAKYRGLIPKDEQDHRHRDARRNDEISLGGPPTNVMPSRFAAFRSNVD